MPHGLPSGGRVAPAARPISGAERIVTLVLGLQKQFERNHASMHIGAINGETGLFVRVDGEIRSAISIATDGDRILAVYAVVNPEKLHAGRPH